VDREQKALAELDRAARAERLFNDELLRDAFDGIRLTYRKRWENTNADETEAREAIYLSLRMLNMVEKQLKYHLETGEMAKIELETIRAGRTAS